MTAAGFSILKVFTTGSVDTGPGSAVRGREAIPGGALRIDFFGEMFKEGYAGCTHRPCLQIY